MTCLGIRKRKGELGKGLATAASTNENKIQKWAEALDEVANLKGWAYPNTKFENEAKRIDDLVHKIFTKSTKAYSAPSEDLVGIRSRMMEVIKLLDLGSDEARVVGLWGMGGIGKTTLAKAVFNSISWQFEGCSFIDNVREDLNTRGVVALQEHLISDILMENDLKIRSSMRGKSIIQNNLYRKKVLIVLDDVSEPKQLEILVGDLHRFGHGSRIIITTRNQHVLTVCGGQNRHVFNVQELDEHEAIQLFKSKAFAKNRETREFRSLIGRAIQYAKGIPLALKVLGSFLLDRTVSEWESALDRLGGSPGDEVQQVLRISFDGLHWTEKEIFLDICCFFKGMHKDRASKILDSFGFDPVIGINVLVKNSLLTIMEHNILWMHDLVQKMGWSIVDEESRKEPGERSRLWRPNDVKHVLMENTGSKKIETISFCYPEYIQIRPDAFAKMTDLRILYFRGTCSSIDLPFKIRLLCWDLYPLTCMPSTFQPEHLVELQLFNSRIERLWDRTTQVLPKLALLDLTNSKNLTKCPEFTCYPNLEYLFLERCTALVDLHPSIKYLKNLMCMNLKGCSSLQTVPYGIQSQRLQWLVFSGCYKLNNILERFLDLKQLMELNLDGTSITELPQSIGKSTNLDHLDLSGCGKLRSIPNSIGHLKKLKLLSLIWCSTLTKLPEEVGLIDSLETLDVSFSGVRQLPVSIGRLRNLQTLVCQGCRATPASFSGFGSLETLDFTDCRLRFISESIFFCLSLKTLYLNGNDFEFLPATIKNLRNLETIWVDECKNLKELPELPSNTRKVEATGCESLETICSPTIYKDARILWFAGCPKLAGNEAISILMGHKFLFNQIKENKKNKSRLYSGPGTKIPEWISYKSIGSLVTLSHQPIQGLNFSNLLGIVFSAVVATKGQKCLICAQVKIGEKIFSYGDLYAFSSDYENVCVLYYPLDEIHMSGIVSEVRFAKPKSVYQIGYYTTNHVLELAPEVKECGAHLIYEEEVGRSGDTNVPLRLAKL